jgi:TRAP-type transport system periplasmic protein
MPSARSHEVVIWHPEPKRLGSPTKVGGSRINPMCINFLKVIAKGNSLLNSLARALLTICAISFAFSSSASSEELKLTFATIAPPNSRVAQSFFHPWAERINEAGKGILRLDVKDGFAWANLENSYSRVLDDVIQIGWGLQSAIGGKFPRSAVAGLPFMTDDCENASVALWRLYKSGLIDDEYSDIVPLALVVFPQSGLHLGRPLDAQLDLAGLKLAVLGKIQGDAIARLGATPLSLPATELYEALQRGLANGVVASWTTFDPFRLGEVTSYHVETRLGTSTGMLFMSKKKFDTLSPEARKVIQDNSAEGSSRQFGGYLDSEVTRISNQIKASEQNKLVRPTDALAAKWQALAEQASEDWLKSVPNGKQVRLSYGNLLAQTTDRR